ncbi:hypothetical protein VTI74DRAFT_358 [Chaetomium olivicolor]
MEVVAPLPLTPSGHMTDVMSYQYPPPPQNGTDIETQASGYLPSYPSGMDPNSNISSRERSNTLKLTRSVSTPVVGQSQSPSHAPQPPASQQLAAPGQDPSGEKRRNKLGYHRTSVACGHCRRRKIRCVPSQNDVQGRCINCIRLKKECSFYPVDQQPPVEARQKSGSRSSVGPKVPSASSSPAMQSGIPSEIHGHQPYPQLTMPSIQSMVPPMKGAGPENYSSDSKIPPASSNAPYGHPGMPSSDPNASWRSYTTDSPITTAFSPYTPHAPAPSATWSGPVGSEPPSRDDIAWSSYPAPPPRSLSFGAESMTGHQQYPSISQVSGHSSRPYDRKSNPATDMYPPPIATTIPGIETVSGTTMDQSISLSAGALPPSNYAPWQQSYSYSRPGEGYNGWYGEAASGEQHPSGHAHHGSNVFYGR